MGQPKPRNGNQAKLRLGVGSGWDWEEVFIAVNSPWKNGGLGTSLWMWGVDSLLAQDRDNLMVSHG